MVKTHPPGGAVSGAKRESRQGGIAGATSIKISTSLPDEIHRHNISDEELDVLCDPSRDELWETKWAAVGAFLGTAPSAIQTGWNYWNSETSKLSIIGLVEILIMVVALAIWFVLRFVVSQKKSTSQEKRDEIRTRTRKIEEQTGNAGTI